MKTSTKFFFGFVLFALVAGTLMWLRHGLPAGIAAFGMTIGLGALGCLTLLALEWDGN